MAEVTKTIGTTSRDYSTITAWEAASYGATGSDDAIGEMYDDSPFDEAVAINDSTPLSIILRVAVGEEGDGTAGTGVRNVRTDSNDFNITVAMTLEDFEYDANGNDPDVSLMHTSGSVDIKRCLFHGLSTSKSGGVMLHIADAANILNSIFYNIAGSSSNIRGINIAGESGDIRKVLNCTIHDITSSGTNSYGIGGIDQANITVQNCISTDSTDGSGDNKCYALDAPSSATYDHNLASDTTASGTGSLDSKTSANQFVSTTGGSEDLHLKAGADAIDAGTDLGTTPFGVEIDIDGRDRDAEGDTWDMGADEFVAVGGATYEKATTDSISLGDTSANVATLPSVIGDSIVLGDSNINTMVRLGVITDSVVFNDLANGGLLFATSLIDSINLGDSDINTLARVGSVSDSINLGDSNINLIVYLSAVTDGVIFNDSIAAALVAVSSISDSVVFNDLANGGLLFVASLTDGVDLGDTITKTLTRVGTVTDSIDLNDSVTTTANLIAAVLDTIDFGDSTILSGNIFNISVGDGITLGDLVSQTGALITGMTVTFTLKQATIAFTIE